MFAFGQGCSVDGTVVYLNKNGGGKYFRSGGMMGTPLVAPSGCYYQIIGGSCAFTDNLLPNGNVVSNTVLECPIDESFIFLGFGILISIISVRKINSTKRRLTEI